MRALTHKQLLSWNAAFTRGSAVDFDQFIESARVLGMYWLLLNKPAVIPTASD